MRRLRRTVALVLMLHMLGACTSWKQVQLTTQPAARGERPFRARVTLTGGTNMFLSTPRVDCDTLRGTVRTDTLRIALVDVSAIRAKRFSAWKTAGLVALVGALFALLAIAVSDMNFGWSWQ